MYRCGNAYTYNKYKRHTKRERRSRVMFPCCLGEPLSPGGMGVVGSVVGSVLVGSIVGRGVAEGEGEGSGPEVGSISILGLFWKLMMIVAFASTWK